MYTWPRYTPTCNLALRRVRNVHLAQIHSYVSSSIEKSSLWLGAKVKKYLLYSAKCLIYTGGQSIRIAHLLYIQYAQKSPKLATAHNILSIKVFCDIECLSEILPRNILSDTYTTFQTLWTHSVSINRRLTFDLSLIDLQCHQVNKMPHLSPIYGCNWKRLLSQSRS